MKKIIYLIIPVIFLAAYKNAPKKPRSGTLFGIDISECQPGNINWKKVKSSKHKVKFVIMRSTMGDDRTDDKFNQRFKEAKAAGFIVGAYHYYDPNENSVKQAYNYLSAIKLKKGDFIPIVDLERLSRIQSTDKLKKGLKNWLDIVEKHYHVKPILYTSYSFYLDNLAKEFSNYPLWVATYSVEKRSTGVVKSCEILQFACRVPVQGIRGRVDGNDIKRAKLKKLLLQ
jgi:lysozyme